MRGSPASQWVICGFVPCTIAKRSGDKPDLVRALFTAPSIIAQVFGCEGWAFATTALPEAMAEAESPPATENASGKLLAAKMATTPSGWFCRRRSGRGAGE